MNDRDEQRRVAAAYRRYALSPRRRRTWAPDNPGNLAIRAELIEKAGAAAEPELGTARRILDIGCGSGWWLEHLSTSLSAALFGVDILPERVEHAQARVPGAQLAVADARELPYPSRSFEVITLFTILSSLVDAEDARRVLHEAARVVAPAGAILVWEPRLPNPLNPETILIREALVRGALPDFTVQTATLTLLPFLARRLGSHTDRLYPLLAGIPALRTHRLMCLRRATPPS